MLKYNTVIAAADGADQRVGGAKGRLRGEVRSLLAPLAPFALYLARGAVGAAGRGRSTTGSPGPRTTPLPCAREPMMCGRAGGLPRARPRRAPPT